MTTELRALHLLSELRPSGAETMLRAAADAFSARGIRVGILSTGRNSIGPYAEELAAAGYVIHHIPFRQSPGFLIALYRYMRRERFDLVHLHMERGNFWIGLTAKAAGARRIVRTIHNNFNFQGSLRWRRRLQRSLLRWLGVTHVAIAPGVQQTERSCFRNETVMIANWYDSARFHVPTEQERCEARKSLGLAPGLPVVLSVGNCSTVKNHVLLLQALARIPRALRPVYLHAGIEDATLSERKVAGELGIADSCRFLGSVGDVWRPLYASDVYVMPSLYEGFTIAALEALATGISVVLTDVAGLRDLKQMFPGLRYVTLDADALAIRIQEALEASEQERTEVGVQRADVARRQFGVDAGVERYARIYRGVGR